MKILPAGQVRVCSSVPISSRAGCVTGRGDLMQKLQGEMAWHLFQNRLS